MSDSGDRLLHTPSQTAGPYVHIGTVPDVAGFDLVPFAVFGQHIMEEGVDGKPITVTFRVFDGADMALKDVLVEIWQADAQGRYAGSHGADPKFHGFARCAADFDSGLLTLDTIRPGAVARDDEGIEAPHLNLWIVARGINTGLLTRVYFPEDDLSNDPLITRIEHVDRRATLVAAATDTGYHHDIHLQGTHETVFFDI